MSRVWYQLENYTLRHALEAIFHTSIGEDLGLKLFVNEDGELAAEVRGFGDLYIAEELGVEIYAVRGLTHEFKEGVYAALARRWAKIVPEIESNGAVYGSVLLPLYYGPIRLGIQWARVAASTALVYCHAGHYLADERTTLYLIAKVVQKLQQWQRETREAYRELAMEFAPWTPECSCVLEPPREASLLGVEAEVGKRCYRWLLDPYLPDGELGRHLHELARSDKPVAIVATETFSPATLYILREAPEIYLIYTPNVYRQVQYAMRIAEDLSLVDRVFPILVSAYNPSITYHILKKKLPQDFKFEPKLTGPMPIYLALKKLSRQTK